MFILFIMRYSIKTFNQAMFYWCFTGKIANIYILAMIWLGPKYSQSSLRRLKARRYYRIILHSTINYRWLYQHRMVKSLFPLTLWITSFNTSVIGKDIIITECFGRMAMLKWITCIYYYTGLFGNPVFSWKVRKQIVQGRTI